MLVKDSETKGEKSDCRVTREGKTNLQRIPGSTESKGQQRSMKRDMMPNSRQCGITS